MGDITLSPEPKRSAPAEARQWLAASLRLGVRGDVPAGMPQLASKGGG